ncbi:MAG: DUF4136 domain-containing protein [Pseudomonadota bacterium]|nr:DUF4136 domain-containing protein [Pseudomonadota bacterium]
MPYFRNIARSLLPLLVLVLVCACATAPRVSSDMDPRADFSGYRSYGLYQPLAMEQSGYSTYLTQSIKDAVRREMEARGYTYDPTDPDVLVNFQGVVRERTDVHSVPRMDIAYVYSYRARHYIGVPLWVDDTYVNRYSQGTLTVDIVDAERNHLVWTGDAVGRVTQKSPQDRAQAADRAISAIFARYPHTVGVSQARPDL